MSQQELLTRVVRTLRSAGIEYMLTGSFASSLQGEPRATHDIDLVVDLRESNVDLLVGEFPAPDFYLSRTAIIEAIRAGKMFNLLELAAGDKVDFWILTAEPFDRSRFSRRQIVETGGELVAVSSSEDTILAKLRWAKLSGGSEKQFGDALRVYEVQYQVLDRDYLEEWVHNLQVQPLWERLLAEADIVTPE